jgi:hypothetical protein
MFVPVSCTSCGKPFQVPESALGKLAPCPWCQAVVTALPVAAPIPQPEPAPQPALTAPPAPEQSKPAAPAQQEPLSLEDEPAPEPRAKAPAPVAVRGDSVRPKEARPEWKLPGTTILVGLLLVVFGTAGTLLVLHYGSGRASGRGWTEFTPADGAFTVALPGAPDEEPVPANPGGSATGGTRYSVRGWYSKTTVWVAYNDLDPGLVQKLPADSSWALAAAALQAERDREKARLGGTITTEVLFRQDAWRGIELHFDTPRGKAVEWLLLVSSGPHPRLYVFGAEARELTPDGPIASRLKNSFRVRE